MTKFDIFADELEYEFELKGVSDVEEMLQTLNFYGSSWLKVKRQGYVEYVPWGRVQRIRVAGQDVHF